MTMNLSRRKLLLETLFGAGMLGLRSLATGIPIAVLANPRKAVAQTVPSCSNPAAQYILLSSSVDGDPLNANVPGMYLTWIPLPSRIALTSSTDNGRVGW